MLDMSEGFWLVAFCLPVRENPNWTESGSPVALGIRLKNCLIGKISSALSPAASILGFICYETPPPTPKSSFGVSDSQRFMRPFGPLNLVLCLKKEALHYRSASLSINQRLPILPGGLPPSTFGVCGLNCCVRHGNRWIPAAIATEFMFQDSYPDNCIKMFVLTTL